MVRSCAVDNQTIIPASNTNINTMLIMVLNFAENIISSGKRIIVNMIFAAKINNMILKASLPYEISQINKKTGCKIQVYTVVIKMYINIRQ